MLEPRGELEWYLGVITKTWFGKDLEIVRDCTVAFVRHGGVIIPVRFEDAVRRFPPIAWCGFELEG